MSVLPATAESELPRGLTPPTRRGRSTRMLGEVAVDLGFATAEQVESAARQAQRENKILGRVLVETGVLNRDQLARVVAERFGLDYVDLSEFKVDMAAANLISSDNAKRYGAVPIGFLSPSRMLVAMADPAPVVIDDIKMMTGMEVIPAIASREDIDVLIGRLNRLDEAVEEAVEDEEDADEVDLLSPRDAEEDAPVIKLVNSIVAQAVEQGASDIHFFPHAGELRVQYRIDGVLTEGVTVPRRLRSGVISRIKIMGEMDIAERRVPQDGRFGLTVDGRSIDVRVVTLPLAGGEGVVMRILDRSGTRIGLDQLGMMPEELDRFTRAFHQAYGAVLVTGPTGSGKTTTLYSAVNELNNSERAIVTIEDPVEYRIDGIRQMQVNVKAGVTFATGLRSMMRADPDVVMVGEIRDRETAQIAVEAALTGHLVLSTLHTNDAPTAVTRLIEMGIEPFLVASAIDCVVAQRLARKLCPLCKKETSYGPDVMRLSGFDVDEPVRAWEPGGCGRCGGTGYKGRIGLYEVMGVSDEIRELILEREAAARIGDLARAQGMRTLREDGLLKIMRGDTSVAEVARVTGTS